MWRKRLSTLLKTMVNNILGKMEDPRMMLEKIYLEKEEELIEVRKAVAKAIAFETRIENQLNEIKEQSDSTENQEDKTVIDLETQLKAQKLITKDLIEKQSKLEKDIGNFDDRNNFFR